MSTKTRSLVTALAALMPGFLLTADETQTTREFLSTAVKGSRSKLDSKFHKAEAKRARKAQKRQLDNQRTQK